MFIFHLLSDSGRVSRRVAIRDDSEECEESDEKDENRPVPSTFSDNQDIFSRRLVF